MGNTSIRAAASFCNENTLVKCHDVSMRWTKRTEWDSKIKSQRDN